MFLIYFCIWCRTSSTATIWCRTSSTATPLGHQTRPQPGTSWPRALPGGPLAGHGCGWRTEPTSAAPSASCIWSASSEKTAFRWLPVQRDQPQLTMLATCAPKSARFYGPICRTQGQLDMGHVKQMSSVRVRPWPGMCGSEALQAFTEGGIDAIGKYLIHHDPNLPTMRPPLQCSEQLDQAHL